jgi:hypothetical protein
MKSKRLDFTLSIIAFVVGSSTFAFAQGPEPLVLDVSKITCKQFALDDEVARPRPVAIWLIGYYAGKRGLPPTVQVQALGDDLKRLSLFCRQVDNLKMPLIEAAGKVLGPGQ